MDASKFANFDVIFTLKNQMRTAGPTTGPAHSAFELRDSFFDTDIPRLRLLDSVYPINKVLACRLRLIERRALVFIGLLGRFRKKFYLLFFWSMQEELRKRNGLLLPLCKKSMDEIHNNDTRSSSV